MKKTWEQRKLGEVLTEFQYGLNTPAISFNGIDKYIRITDIDENTHRFNVDNITSPKETNDDYLLTEGDILFARTGASVGKTYIYNSNDGKIYYAGFLIKGHIRKNYDSRFVFETTLLSRYTNFVKITSIRSGQPGINANEYKKYTFYTPTLNEQRLLSTLMQKLEKLLSLQQRKLKQLKRLKKAMLQQLLVSKKDRLTPNVRFSDFSGSWKKCKLGEVIQDYIEKTIVENQYPILTSSQQHGIILQNEYFSGSRVSKTGNIGYFILPRGYFAYRNRSDNDTYVFNRNDCIDREIISRFYPVFKPYNADSNFLLIRLNNGLRKELSLASEGTGQHVLSLKNFKNIQTQFPNLEEQHKIGDFISTLNSLIALHQRKANILSNLKKFLLQKLFI
ncbi:restriction endonuclease subunit S [Limosilactobacillus vaginalis]|uniref:restriction endonuclease subunit S n=1 Tax=Limosilactobacillus vaginalis TaxID=1633 RepID=UPI00241C1803|nr:restriction endonuclease subunit S [Limosilactobacillus vaginalis]